MKKKSILKIIFKVAYGIGKACVLGFLLIFALIVCLQRFSNNSISLFNYRLFSVVTGSMAPMYNIGDILLCKEVDVNTLKIGDDISYVGDDGTYKDKVITHRIIDIKKDENGEPVFYTKGIATSVVDPAVTKEQIYGKIVNEIEPMSRLYKFVSTTKGFYMAIFVPLTLLIGSEVIVSMVEKAKDKKEAKEEKVKVKNEPKKLEVNEDSKKAEIKAEIERIEKEIEEKKKAEVKAEIERLQKELEEKNKK